MTDIRNQPEPERGARLTITSSLTGVQMISLGTIVAAVQACLLIECPNEIRFVGVPPLTSDKREEILYRMLPEVISSEQAHAFCFVSPVELTTTGADGASEQMLVSRSQPAATSLRRSRPLATGTMASRSAHFTSAPSPQPADDLLIDCVPHSSIDVPKTSTSET
jgi:hypothetical protein